MKYKIQLDGNMWCAIDEDTFVNLEKSDAGFAETAIGALAALLNRQQVTLLNFCKVLAQESRMEQDLVNEVDLEPSNSYGNGDNQFFDGATRAKAIIALSARKLIK